MAINYDIALNYLLCFIGGALILNFLMGGFILEWWRARRSKGKRLLIRVKNPFSPYWRTGSFDNGYLQYKARKRRDNPNPNRSIFVKDDILARAIKHDWGVAWVEVDDEKGCILYLDGESYKAVTGFNQEKMDEIVQTALNKPSKQDGLFDARTRDMIMVGGFILVIIASVMIYKRLEVNDANAKLLYDMVKPIYEVTFGLNATGVPV